MEKDKNETFLYKKGNLEITIVFIMKLEKESWYI